jgi:hypothetical protein
MISEVRRRGPELTVATRALWLVVAVIVLVWVVLVLVGAATAAGALRAPSAGGRALAQPPWALRITSLASAALQAGQ